MRSGNIVVLCVIMVALSSCGTRQIQPSGKHIQYPVASQEAATSSLPQPITGGVVLPPPKPAEQLATYSVVVSNVPVQEVLFALARDAKLNLDIHPGIGGTATINAVNQTLQQILTRISRQVDMRYEIDNGTLTVMPDSPYLRNYKIDYVNMTRDADSSIAGSTLINAVAPGSAGGAGNNSALAIKNTSKNHFWETLVQNIKDILRETDKVFPEGSNEVSVQQVRAASGTTVGKKKASSRASGEVNSVPIDIDEEDVTVTRRTTFREAASVIANPENGVITVRATGKQHEKIQEFVDQVMANARRQVLIEATVVEVNLSDEYQQGINWSALRLGNTGFQLTQQGSSGLPTASTETMFVLDYANPASPLGSLGAQISLLESFGNVKVLSSPKLSVMNNQTAMLRVVDNLVHFTVDVEIEPPSSNGPGRTTYTTTINTTPVGFTMSVTPQISDNDTVLLNVRPSISRLLGYVNDPNPVLATAKVQSRIPQIQTREMESMLKIENNQIAVMGGLMQDSINNLTDEVPLLGRIPLIGPLFQHRKDRTEKTELVIFLRPVVIKNASVEGDFAGFRDKLPDGDFFKDSGRDPL